MTDQLKLSFARRGVTAPACNRCRQAIWPHYRRVTFASGTTYHLPCFYEHVQQSKLHFAVATISQTNCSSCGSGYEGVTDVYVWKRYGSGALFATCVGCSVNSPLTRMDTEWCCTLTSNRMSKR